MLVLTRLLKSTSFFVCFRAIWLIQKCFNRCCKHIGYSFCIYYCVRPQLYCLTPSGRGRLIVCSVIWIGSCKGFKEVLCRPVRKSTYMNKQIFFKYLLIQYCMSPNYLVLILRPFFIIANPF